jgi:hypothetical protein
VHLPARAPVSRVLRFPRIRQRRDLRSKEDLFRRLLHAPLPILCPDLRNDALEIGRHDRLDQVVPHGNKEI